MAVNVCQSFSHSVTKKLVWRELNKRLHMLVNCWAYCRHIGDAEMARMEKWHWKMRDENALRENAKLEEKTASVKWPNMEPKRRGEKQPFVLQVSWYLLLNSYQESCMIKGEQRHTRLQSIHLLLLNIIWYCQLLVRHQSCHLVLF